MSQARLWRDRGDRDQARDLLAPVYGWFTEGHDTLDLQDAKALLHELANEYRDDVSATRRFLHLLSSAVGTLAPSRHDAEGCLLVRVDRPWQRGWG
jgi:hypothetical protein